MRYSLICLLSLALFSCQNEAEKKEIAKADDYSQYLSESNAQKSVDLLNLDLEFWSNKLQSNQKSFTYISKIAGLYSQKFRVDGDVKNIHTSDSLFKVAVEINPFSDAAIYQALSSNSITKHEFSDAKNYAELALKEGDKQMASYYLLFDALLELGELNQAKSVLALQENKNTFDYKIRASKVSDHEGDLDKAIALMEEAFEKVKGSNSLFVWSKANLADMYGHAGRIEESYQAYLEVLKKEPEHWHSLQGIAWIAFAHDNNTLEAKRIIIFVKAKNNDPQLTLLLAEIAEFEKDEEHSKTLRKEYYDQVSSPQYLGMYNKYIILLEAEDLKAPAAAVYRSKAEVSKRPTPEVYDLLAWAHLQNGEPEKALEVAKSFVLDRTSEPEALFHLGMIYKSNNMNTQAKSYLTEALKSSFELGPVTTEKIKKAL
ncbi:MAG: tetratricopeptide (TPR) repeat protein [Candidatus Endobugula sp.]|jgi:tetratricopeptide (TPR) repeat protein